MGQGHSEEFVARREDLGAATAHLIPAIAVLVTKLLRLPERESDETRRIAKLERQLVAAREAVKVEKAANAVLVRERERLVAAPRPSVPVPRAERLLDVAVGALWAAPPAGIDPVYVEGFVARNRGALLAIVRGAFPGR